MTAATFQTAYNEYRRRIDRNSSASWIRKAYNECIRLWDATASWAKNFIFNAAAKLSERFQMKVRKQNEGEPIEWVQPPLFGSTHYTVNFYNENGEYMFTKTGKADQVKVRILQEIKDYNASRAVVLRVTHCASKEESERMERHYRHMVHRELIEDPDKIIPWDRFIYPEYDPAHFDKFLKKFDQRG